MYQQIIGSFFDKSKITLRVLPLKGRSNSPTSKSGLTYILLVRDLPHQQNVMGMVPGPQRVGQEKPRLLRSLALGVLNYRLSSTIPCSNPAKETIYRGERERGDFQSPAVPPYTLEQRQDVLTVSYPYKFLSHSTVRNTNKMVVGLSQ